MLVSPKKMKDPEKFDEKMQKLTSKLAEEFKKSNILEIKIKNNLSGLGYDF